MAIDLTSWVHTRLEADEKLSEHAKLLILAALEGETSLADLAGFTPPEPAAEVAEDAEPAGAFLKQIKVQGFRGIGPLAQVDLDPFPSLTVISGRNGSGKSSFAEALEVALTGSTFRWKARASQWQGGWRNMHAGKATRIEVTLAEEGIGPTKLSVEWAEDAAFDNSSASMQRQGEKKQAGTASLGWAGPLETYRPLLTYEELGALLSAEPSALYDAISTVLGLGQISTAATVLDNYRKSCIEPQTQLTRDKKALLLELLAVEDDRAADAQNIVKARDVDVDELRRLATGVSGEGGATT